MFGVFASFRPCVWVPSPWEAWPRRRWILTIAHAMCQDPEISGQGSVACELGSLASLRVLRAHFTAMGGRWLSEPAGTMPVTHPSITSHLTGFSSAEHVPHVRSAPRQTRAHTTCLTRPHARAPRQARPYLSRSRVSADGCAQGCTTSALVTVSRGPALSGTARLVPSARSSGILGTRGLPLQQVDPLYMACRSNDKHQMAGSHTHNMHAKPILHSRTHRADRSCPLLVCETYTSVPRSARIFCTYTGGCGSSTPCSSAARTASAIRGLASTRGPTHASRSRSRSRARRARRRTRGSRARTAGSGRGRGRRGGRRSRMRGAPARGLAWATCDARCGADEVVVGGRRDAVEDRRERVEDEHGCARVSFAYVRCGRAADPRCTQTTGRLRASSATANATTGQTHCLPRSTTLPSTPCARARPPARR
jgi:hypothetical protein